MKIFALSDPHLAFNTQKKKMNIFGDAWNDHPIKIKQNWLRFISTDDIIIIPGDISWGKKFEQALADLYWLDALPGNKIILKGNHDYWWPKNISSRANLPSSISVIKNNHLKIGKYIFFGTRLWDTQEYSCDDIIDWDVHKGNYLKKKTHEELKKQEQIYNREIQKLEFLISALPEDKNLVRIGMCHYPPLDPNLNETRASKLFAAARTKHVIFGHLHSIKQGVGCFGKLGSTHYHLTSGDYLRFIPKLICGD